MPTMRQAMRRPTVTVEQQLGHNQRRRYWYVNGRGEESRQTMPRYARAERRRQLALTLMSRSAARRSHGVARR